jgi:hypothetical protein
MPRPMNEYEYDESPENPGMNSAVENARARKAYDTAADGNPVKYDPADQPLPDDDPKAMQLPELDFSDSGPFGKDSGGPDDDLKLLQNQPTGDGPGPGALQFNGPTVKTPAQQGDDEYTSALRKIKERLSQPTPNYSKGLADAQQADNGENRTSKILAYLSAGLRRASVPTFAPAATNASDFVRNAQLQQQTNDGELSRLGRLASIVKPKAATSKDAGNVESLRAYLVKVGAGSAPELADMNEKQLGAVMQAYGLKHRIEREPVEDQFKTTFHNDNVASTNATREQTLALENRNFNEKNNDQISADAKELAGKLGDTAAFEEKYKHLKALAASNGGKLPGLGVIEGVRQQPGLIGSAARAVSPPSQQAVEGRKLLKQLASDYGRAISGAGVSDKEREQLQSATVDVDNGDPTIAMAGLESLRSMYEAKAAQLKKGYRPEAVRQVAGDAPPAAGTVKMKFPDGSVHDVSPEKLDKARAKGGVPVDG